MKKNIQYKWFFGVLILCMLIACNDDFLERYPLDSMSDATFFTSANDLKAFTAGFYKQLPLYEHWENNKGLDHNTDMVIQQNPAENLMQQGASGQAADFKDVNKNWNRHWDWIRQFNYFLENAYKVSPMDAAAKHYKGEGYFWRARRYYHMLVDYGDVPIIKEALNVDSEKLYKTRDSRYDVAKFIMEDLDSAIVNLEWKGEGAASDAGRVNKESAIILKARVALFEGTWERYHGAKGTPFAVNGKDGTEFLQMIEPAINELIDHQGTNIFTDGGPLNEPYNQITAQNKADQTEGVFFYRVYDPELFSSHDFFGGVLSGPNGVTKRLVDYYLAKDGKPQSLSALPVDPANLTNLSENLDPRFSQTIWTPDKGPQNRLPEFETLAGPARYPVITSFDNSYISTGLKIWKGAVFDASQWRLGEVDDVFIRYAEGLLALAEAKAILGTITQSDIDKTVNVLRDRVGMAHMNLGEVEGWPSGLYQAPEGFNPSESNILNEIRRERSIEFAAEGYRLNDLKRWAVYDDAINGQKPQGAHLQQFLDYFNDPVQLADDGFTPENIVSLSIIIGDNVDIDADGYINPFFRTPEFIEGGSGYYIDPGRDYLMPIPPSQIDLYLEKGGVTLSQNPGWF